MSIIDAWKAEEESFWEWMKQKEYPPIPPDKKYKPKRFQQLANAQKEKAPNDSPR
jgi:hypothetical protein